MTVFEHPQLGCIRGRHQYRALEFRGLKYASLTNKIAPAVIYEGSDKQTLSKRTRENPLDATKTGPCVISPAGACDFEYSLYQHKLPNDETLVQSDVECLNLNVAVPEFVEERRSLPVMVFVHGGGLTIGSANWPQNSLARFVSYSLEIAKPIIAVGINYRVGPIGFLTSEELRHAGYPANNGLRDQRVALQWVKKFISGFGGNPDEICVMGQSAGGVSATLQLASEEPLFRRLICLSGTFLAVRPLSAAIHEERYKHAIKLLSLEGLQPEDRIKALESIEASEIVAKLGMSVPVAPMIDGDICHDMPTFAALKGGPPKTLSRNWCMDVFLEFCQFDGSIFALSLEHRKTGISSAFAASLRSSLADFEGAAAGILEAYDIDPNREDDDDTAFRAILRFCQDIAFKAAAIILAEEWVSGTAYLSQFSAINPWRGPWQGLACHITDLAHLLQNYDIYLPESQREVGHQMGRDIIQFIYGQAPWSSTGSNRSTAKEYHSTGAKVVEGRLAQEAPIWNLISRFTADVLLNAVDNFLGGL